MDIEEKALLGSGHAITLQLWAHGPCGGVTAQSEPQGVATRPGLTRVRSTASRRARPGICGCEHLL